ncbi:MAG: O-antigen ligase family protein [Oscillospiraceae bacterium]|nr:O-antigen ligase family protein [Oscillospiraceae bacterium]
MRINREKPLVQRIDQILYSPVYFVVLGGLTILSNVFSMELVAYTLLLATGIYVCLYGRDLLPIFPIFVFGYISPSRGNNPGLIDNSVFSLQGGGIYLAILLTAFAVSLVYRVVTDPVFGGKKFLQKKRQLLSGMLVLGAAYAVSGVFSGQWAEYGWRNLLFAFLQLVAIAGLYYLLSGAVQWESAPKAYLFWTGISFGYVLLIELIAIYFKEDVIVNGSIWRERIITGWGHYNSIGALFAMVIPLPFFLTGKGKYAWFAYLSAFLFCIGLLFTCSRGSIIVGVPIYLATYVLSVLHSRHARLQKWTHVLHALIIGTPILVLVVFNDELQQLFRNLPVIGTDASFRMRLDTYVEGFKQFAKFPVFGGSFFPLKEDLYKWALSSTTFGYLFPPRWHNTIIQLLATGGVVCFAAYLVHRVQTIKLFTSNFTTEKLFVALSFAALLLTSMGDCHFFNVGPVLIYSGALAIVECKLNKTVTK